MDIKAKSIPMKSAMPHAGSDAPYRMVMGKDGKAWFYRTGKFAATAIYVDGGKGSEGMGGRVCRFELEDGSFFDSIGPWMSNANHLFQMTGVDLRDKYATSLILSRQVHYPKDSYGIMPDMLDVVHYEPEFVEGTFDRPNLLAQKIANDLDETLYYFIETSGGAQSGQVRPQRSK